MYVILGISSLTFLCYLLNCNKNKILFNAIDVYSKIENNYNYIYSYFLSKNKYILEEITDIDNKETNFYILNFSLLDNNLFQIIDLEENNENTNKFIDILNNSSNKTKYVNYKSPIISCFMYSENNEYDITPIINKFINYNSKLVLNNKQKYKMLWINLYNKYNNNLIVNIKDTENFKWKIILDSIKIYDEDNFLLEVNDGILKIN